jgi:hypothetical protein
MYCTSSFNVENGMVLNYWKQRRYDEKIGLMQFAPHELDRTERKTVFFHTTVDPLSYDVFHFAMNENKN